MTSTDLFRYSPGGTGGQEDESDWSNEDTDEASEDYDDSPKRIGNSTAVKRPYTEIKEQMYQDKLGELKRQLAQLNEGSHPEWTKKLRRLETSYRERLRINTVIRDLEIEMVEQDFVNEKKSAVREFEDHKIYLRDHLISELEEKQKMIETERHNMELTGDSFDLKPISTRKLRRRANEPTGSSNYGPGDKRRKPTQLSAMTYLLEDTDIIEDLKIINKNKAFTIPKPGPPVTNSSSGGSSSPLLPSFPRDIKIVDGKLFYEKRWFRRGQAVQVEAKSGDKFPAMISAIGWLVPCSLRPSKMMPVPYHGCTCHLRYAAAKEHAAVVASNRKQDGKLLSKNGDVDAAGDDDEEEDFKVDEIRPQPWYFHIVASFILVVHGFTFLVPQDSDSDDTDMMRTIGKWFGFDWEWMKPFTPYAQGLASVFNISLGIVSWWTSKESDRYNRLIQLRVFAFCVNILHAYITGPIIYQNDDSPLLAPGTFTGRIIGLFRLSYLTPGLMAAGVTEVIVEKEQEQTKKEKSKKTDDKKELEGKKDRHSSKDK